MSATLAIDTSSSLSSIALRREDGAIFEYEGGDPNSHNETLIGHVLELLSQAGVRPSQLGVLIDGAGPGSFTGLRISLSFLKGLSLGLGIPLHCLSSLAAIAASAAASEAGIVISLADARRDEIFCGAFDRRHGYAPICAEMIIPIGEFSKFAEEICRNATGTTVEIVTCGVNSTQLGTALKTTPASHFARGLLNLLDKDSTGSSFSLPELCAAAPHYMRAVSAKTIEERERRASRAAS